MAKMINVDELIEFCNTERAMLHARGNSVTCAALRRVVEFAKEYAVEVEPVNDNWISVEDKLPDKSQKVLAFYKALGEKNRIHNDLIATNWRKSNGDFIPTAGYEVTHWMPLPEPPKEDKDEEI